MKKFLGLLMVLFIGFGASAQEKVEVKKTTTVGQKVHNATHKNKRYKGYKVKKKRANGHKTVHKVNHMNGDVKDKSKQAGEVEKTVTHN